MATSYTAGQAVAAKRAQTHQEARVRATKQLKHRGYQVSTNRAGLLSVVSPKGEHFHVAVNGQMEMNAWLTRTRQNTALYYILVYVISESTARFFVLSKSGQDEENALYQRLNPNNRNITGGGFGWDDALEFEDCWETLPN